MGRREKATIMANGMEGDKNKHASCFEFNLREYLAGSNFISQPTPNAHQARGTGFLVHASHIYLCTECQGFGRYSIVCSLHHADCDPVQEKRQSLHHTTAHLQKEGKG